MIEAYKNYWKNGVNFNDRATPGEYWWPILVNLIITIILCIPMFGGIISMIYHESTSGFASFGVFGIILAIFFLANFLPALSVTIRRLHDIGLNWITFLLIIIVGFIPVVGTVVRLLSLILYMLPSDQFSDWDNFLSWDDNL